MARAWLAAVGRGSRGARGTVGLAVGRRLSAAAAANGWMPPREDKDAMKSRLAQAQKAAAAPPQLTGVKPRPVQSAAVIGSGTMGAGIAMCFAEAGIPVAQSPGPRQHTAETAAARRPKSESPQVRAALIASSRPKTNADEPSGGPAGVAPPIDPTDPKVIR